MWFRSCLGNKGFGLAFFQDNAYLAVGVIKVTEIHAFRRAYRNACRLHTLVYPVDAEGTLVNIAFGMRVTCIIGA